MIIFMIVLGGFVRLTDSGLSIVEWKPLSGVIPPITKQSWIEEFTKYQASPEYKLHNYGMQLGQFKFIFWLEFIHRIFGRILGLVYLLPFLYFYFSGAFDRKAKPWYVLTSLLLIAQGLMGWYMVKSGLVDKPYVSHFRLASHLIIAVLMYSILFWQLLRCGNNFLLVTSQTNLHTHRILAIVGLALLFGQIFLGALVAGLDAGLVYNSFPLMGEKFVPQEVQELFTSGKALDWHEPVLVQFVHRMTAYIISVLIFLLALMLQRTNYLRLKKASIGLLTSLLLQMLIGVLTVLYSVPIVIALLHQFGAIVLLSVLLYCTALLWS